MSKVLLSTFFENFLLGSDLISHRPPLRLLTPTVNQRLVRIKYAPLSSSNLQNLSNGTAHNEGWNESIFQTWPSIRCHTWFPIVQIILSHKSRSPQVCYPPILFIINIFKLREKEDSFRLQRRPPTKPKKPDRERPSDDKSAKKRKITDFFSRVWDVCQPTTENW